MLLVTTSTCTCTYHTCIVLRYMLIDISVHHDTLLEVKITKKEKKKGWERRGGRDNTKELGACIHHRHFFCIQSMKTKCDLMRCFASPLHPILYAMQTHVVVCTVILTNFLSPFCCFILTWHTHSNYCWCHFCDTGYVLSVFRSLSKRWALSCCFLPFSYLLSLLFFFFLTTLPHAGSLILDLV